MSFRTATRAAAVLGSAAVLSIAGAGAAMATTHANEVDGNTVSVTFNLDGGFIDGDTCGAVLTPTAAAAGVAKKFASGDIKTIFNTLTDDKDVIVLYRDGLVLDTPFVVLGKIGGVGVTSATVSATVPSNVYSLVSVCLSARTSPKITPTLTVGDPIEAVQGSVSTLSSDGNLTAGSTLSADAASGNLGGGSSDLLGGGTGSAGE